MEQGRAVVRRRADGATELRVNGVFVMDDRETLSERLLAARAAADVTDGATVLVGGLGLGYTVRELLTDTRVRRIVVAEIEPAVVEWMRTGEIGGADLLAEPRVDVRVADVRDVVADARPATYDAILLDVDNGPDFLVLEENAALYEPAFFGLCASRLRRDGVLCIWSQDDSPPVRQALATAFETVTTERVPVRLQGRAEAYWLIRGHRPTTGG